MHGEETTCTPGEKAEAATTGKVVAASRSCGAGSARLAVQGVLAVPGAELLQLDAVRVVTAVLAGDVVPLLALRTRQGDLRTDVGRLGHGGVPSSLTGVTYGAPA